MTTAGTERPLTAADLLFGSSADASKALTREIMSASRAQNLGHALKHLPKVTREAAAREATLAAAGLMKVDLMDVLAAGWREHREIIAAARRTLATPGSKELVGVAAHRITTLQQPAVSVLIDGRRVHTLQLGLSIVFEVTGLVAGVSHGRLAGIHAGRCEVGVALTVHEIEVLTKRAHHLELPGVMALKAGFRLLPGNEYPSGEYQSAGLRPGSHFGGSQFPGVELLGHEFAGPELAGAERAHTEFVGPELKNAEHASAALSGTEHASDGHAGGQHAESLFPGTQHDSREHGGTEHSDFAAGAEHASTGHAGGDHPADGPGAEHPSAPAEAAVQARVPWWEDMEAAPPSSQSQ
jgi:hypothetical protein